MPGHSVGGIFVPLPGPVSGEVRDGFLLAGPEEVHGQDGVDVADRDRNFPGQETFSQEFYSYLLLVVEPPPSDTVGSWPLSPGPRGPAPPLGAAWARPSI